MEDVKKLKAELRQRDLKIKELETLITKDPLTGLYNRRGFLELAQGIFKEVQYYQKTGKRNRTHFYVDSISILFFDIDHFKKINDTYGHDVGDKVLKFVSLLINNKMRASDFVGRWGGEEIVVMLLGAKEKDAFLKAEEIRKAIKSRVKVPGHKDLKVTISVGVAELDHHPTLEDIIKSADKALYAAKKGGRDQTVKYENLSN